MPNRRPNRKKTESLKGQSRGLSKNKSGFDTKSLFVFRKRSKHFLQKTVTFSKNAYFFALTSPYVLKTTFTAPENTTYSGSSCSNRLLSESPTGVSKSLKFPSLKSTGNIYFQIAFFLTENKNRTKQNDKPGNEIETFFPAPPVPRVEKKKTGRFHLTYCQKDKRYFRQYLSKRPKNPLHIQIFAS